MCHSKAKSKHAQLLSAVVQPKYQKGFMPADLNGYLEPRDSEIINKIPTEVGARRDLLHGNLAGVR